MLKPDRLCAFSDGVIAIAITLLVLGLEVPSVHEVPDVELPEYLRGTIHPLLGFVLSFTLIGTYWLQHYAIFHYIEHVSKLLFLTTPIIYFSHQAVDKGWIRPENADLTSPQD